MTRRALGVVALAVALGLGIGVGACDPENGSNDTENSPQDRDDQPEFAEPGSDPWDEAAFDPCDLLPPEVVSEHSDLEEDALRYQGLGQDERVVDCQIGNVSTGTFNVGLVAHDPPEDLLELLPTGADTGDRPGAEEPKPLENVGDEAYLFKDRHKYYVVVGDGDVQMLLVRGVETDDEEDRQPDVEAMAREAAERMPRSVELGQQVLPRECDALDTDAIEEITTEVAVAAGSRGEEGLVCDYLGTGYTRILATAIALPPDVIAERIEYDRDNQFYTEVSDVEDGAVVFRDDDRPGYHAYVDEEYDINLRLESVVREEDYENEVEASPEASEALLSSVIDTVRQLG